MSKLNKIIAVFSEAIKHSAYCKTHAIHIEENYEVDPPNIFNSSEPSLLLSYHKKVLKLLPSHNLVASVPGRMPFLVPTKKQGL
jgi:hypothetical protein